MTDDWQNCPAIDIGGAVIYDVSLLLPRARNTIKRRPSEVDTITVHHSGALNRPGYAGLLASTRYVINTRKFRSSAYHFWISYRSCYDDDGYRVVFQSLGLNEVGSHCGGINRRSVGVCLQGNLTAKPVSDQQNECLPLLTEYLQHVLPVKRLIMHCEAGQLGGHSKHSCPGLTARALVESIRDKSFHV